MTTLSVAWARVHGIRVAWRNEAPGTGLAAPGSGGHRPASRSGTAQTQTAAPPEAPPPAPETEVYPDWDAIYTDNVGRIYRLLFAKVGNRPDAEDLTSQVFLAALGPLRTTASVGEVRAYLLATARTALAAHWRRTLGHQVTVIDPAGMELAEFAGTADGSRPGGSVGLDPPYGGPGRDAGTGAGEGADQGREHGRDAGADRDRDADPGQGGARGPDQRTEWSLDRNADREDWAPDDPRLRADRILAALPDRQRRILTLRFLQGCSVKEAAAELGVTVANAKVLQHRALRRAAGLDQETERKGDA